MSSHNIATMMMGIPFGDQDYLRWQSRGKRTRRPNPISDEISAAAEALMLLASSNGGFCTATPKSTSYTSLPCTDSANFEIKKHQELSCSAASSATATARVWLKKDERPNSPDTPLQLGAHDCWECGKIFKSHQALGGHMRKHRRKLEATTTAVSVGMHECTDCHQHFSTGQALGGHKRKHYDAVGLIASKKFKKKGESESISHRDDRGGATRDVARVMNIDLNMPPAMEELDDEELQFRNPNLFLIRSCLN